MDNLGRIEFDRRHINLTSSSLDKLKELLKEVNDNEKMVKQEIDAMLKRLI